jgi:hypothetical protein
MRGSGDEGMRRETQTAGLATVPLISSSPHLFIITD